MNSSGEHLLAAPAKDEPQDHVVGSTPQSAITTDGSAFAVSIDASRPLRLEIAWAGLGNIAILLGQFGMLVVVGHLGTTEDLGTLGLATAVTAPPAMLATAQLRSLLVSDVACQNTVHDYATIRALSIAAFLAIVGLSVIPFSRQRATVLVMGGMALAKAADLVSDLLWGIIQRLHGLRLVARSQVLRAACSLTTFAIALILTRSVAWAVLSLAVVGVVCSAAFDLRRVHLAWRVLPATHPWRNGRGSRRNRLRKLIVVSAPFAASAMTLSYASSVPRFFLEVASGRHDVGVYSAVAAFVSAVAIVGISVSQAILPRLSTHAADHQRSAFLRTLLMTAAALAAIGCVLAAAAWIGGNGALRILFGTELATYDWLLWRVLIVSALQLALFPVGAALLTFRMSGVHLAAAVACLIGAGSASWLLIPARGLAAIPVVLLVAYVCQTVVSMGPLSHRLRTLSPRNLA